MNTDYVNFETSAILKIDGFDKKCDKVWVKKYDSDVELIDDSHFAEGDDIEYHPAPSLWDVMIWLKDVHHILVIVDYEYECTDKSYYYKIYRLGENGKPERAEVTGVRYDKDGNQHTETIGYRDYIRSCEDYEKYEEALVEGIKYALEKYDIDDINYGKSI